MNLHPTSDKIIEQIEHATKTKLTVGEVLLADLIVREAENLLTPPESKDVKTRQDMVKEFRAFLLWEIQNGSIDRTFISSRTHVVPVEVLNNALEGFVTKGLKAP
jgi:hypothetical protein